MESTGEEDPTDFFEFGGILDDIEAEDEVIQQKKVSKIKVEELMEHLGGFEFWPVLIDDCKEVVAKFLDPITLIKLGMCSKTDYDLVNKVPIHLRSIEVEDNNRYHYQFENEPFDNVIVRMQIGLNSSRTFEMVFSQLGEDTQVRWRKFPPRKRPETASILIKDTDYYDEAVKFVEKWMERCQYKLEKLLVNMSRYSLTTSKVKSLPNCTSIRVGSSDISALSWWLEKVPVELESLNISCPYEERDTFTIPTNFLSSPKVMNVKGFYFYCRAAFTDEQFLDLKAERFSFDSVNITDDGINKFLKRWVNGGAVDGFKDALLWSNRVPDQARVMRGLHARPWDHDFEVEARGFCCDYERCCGRGESFQISSRVEPLDSLTLSFSGDRISIYATGKKFTWNGSTYTSYRIP